MPFLSDPNIFQTIFTSPILALLHLIYMGINSLVPIAALCFHLFRGIAVTLCITPIKKATSREQLVSTVLREAGSKGSKGLIFQRRLLAITYP